MTPQADLAALAKAIKMAAEDWIVTQSGLAPSFINADERKFATDAYAAGYAAALAANAAEIERLRDGMAVQKNTIASQQNELVGLYTEIERLTKVLEPFAKIGRQVMDWDKFSDDAPGWCMVTAEGGITTRFGDFRNAARAQQPSPAAEGGEDE